MAFSSDGNMHPGTVVAATARMAGTYLFRSFKLNLTGVQAGHAVLSAPANEQAPVLIRIAAAIVATFNITLDNSQAAMPNEPRHEPRLPFLETQRLLEPIFRAITDPSGMSDYEGARAAAVAAALLISQCAKVMEPHTGFRITSYGIIEGSKTAPDPVQFPHSAI